MNANTTYWVLFIGVAVLSYIVQAMFQRRIDKASRIPMKRGLTGREVAELMLRDHGINNVSVISTPGQLTDNFNPSNNTVNLSESVYSQSSVAAGRRGSSRVRACSSARDRLSSCQAAQRTCSNRIFFFKGCDVGASSRDASAEDIPRTDALRHHTFRLDDSFQHRHTAG